jgi:asparagine synthase (glutamine-hydrolysing)
MCGIAGIIKARDAAPIEQTVLDQLAAALAHRGPDGHGFVIHGNTALVHTRLAIIDLATGDQPLHRECRVLVANGEIYNDLATRASLPGIKFNTGSDCEPPLYLHEQYGLDMAAHLRGMYAIALHNDEDGSVTLSRDPFGIKPFYLAKIDGGIAFASEPAVLTKAGLVTPRVHSTALGEMLQTQFCLGVQTIFDGITRLLPGETVKIENGRVTERRKIAAISAGGPENISEEAALKRLDAAIMESVSVHQRSDVPFGLFLSGGIDSATILAAMARLNERPVTAFTAGFDVRAAADERAQAARVAKSVSAEHHTIEITEAMVWRHLPKIVACMDDAASDYAIIPTWFLARSARPHVKVVLSGEGGDEIFGGYGRYRKAMRPWFLSGKRIRLRGNFDGLNVLRETPRYWRAGLEAEDKAAQLPGRTRLQIVQAADVTGWLPNDLLIKLDRCLMAHGIEGRTPFLDPAIAAAGFRLPDHLKIRDGRGKYLLRLWLSKAMPAANPFAPKQGFTVPVGAWIAEQGAALGELVARQPGIEEIAKPDAVKNLFAHAAKPRADIAAWNLLFYALWHRVHIEQQKPDGSAMDVLS